MNDPVAELPSAPPAERVATPPRERRRWPRRVTTVLFCLGLLLSATAVLLPFRTNFEGGLYDLFATLVFFARVFVLPIAALWLILAIFTAITRQWHLAIASTLFALAWAAPEAWLAWPRSPTIDGPTFTVASFNLNKDLHDATWAAEVMRQMNADFVVLQELSPHSAEQIEQSVGTLYPHRRMFPDPDYNGMAVLSKTPLTLLHKPQGYLHRDLQVIASDHGHEFRLLDLHLAPPQMMEKRRWNRFQTTALIEQLSAESRPTILAGDYNFTALSQQAFALRSAGFPDAHLQAGRGRESTWPMNGGLSFVPSVRIDTVYARGLLHAVKSERGPRIGSDHLPIKITWCWSAAATTQP